MANVREAIQMIALDAVKTGNPTSIVYGKVISEEPLQVQINSKLTLDESFLVLTKNVSDYEVEIDLAFEGEGRIAIAQGMEEVLKKISMEKAKITIQNALKAGDEVVMIQAQGGQKYVVLDKLEKESG